MPDGSNPESDPRIQALRRAATSFHPTAWDECELSAIPAYKLSDTPEEVTLALVSVHVEDDKPGFAMIIITDPPHVHRFVVELDEIRTVL